jgi:molybdate transport system substrate-binding protein
VSPSHPTFRTTPGALAALAILLGSSALACSNNDRGAGAVLILAAASTVDALESAVADFESETSTRVVVSFGSTSTMARQLEMGAPADLMLSASVDWADHLVQRVPVTERLALVANQLAVVVPQDAEFDAVSLYVLASDPRFSRIAVADPTSVPAGIYAAEALRGLFLWEAMRPRLVPTVDVRAALALVADKEVDAGIVYATDAASTPRVRLVARVDPQLHPPIEYPLLLLADARAGARELFEFLGSARGRAHFYDRGFVEAGR